MKSIAFGLDDDGDAVMTIVIDDAHFCIPLDGEEIDHLAELIATVQLESKVKRS